MYEKNGFLHNNTTGFNRFKLNYPVIHSVDPVSAKPTLENTRWKLLMVNRFGVCYFWTLSFAMFSVGNFIALPVVYSYSEDILWNRRLLSVFLLATTAFNNILTIFFYRRSVYGAGTHSALGALPDGKWSRCDSCELAKPPRCHHCIMCQKCILKRDHHCYFTGVCIGAYNQRHFLALCLHSGVSLFYSFYVLCNYFMIEYRHPIILSWYHFILPFAFVEMVFGYVTIFFFFMLLLTYLTLCTAGGAMFLFIAGFYFALQDLTSYEFGSKQLHQRNSSSWINNLRSVFGSFGFIQLIIPVPCLPIPDTMIYVKSNYVKNIWIQFAFTPKVPPIENVPNDFNVMIWN